MNKPKHLGPEYSAQFQDVAVVAAYHHRQPYPAAVFEALVSRVAGEPRTVLDIGCGTGDVARPLAPHVDRIDAVDISAAMVAKGRVLPGGDHPAIRWLVASAEEAPFVPPYGLVTAGESLHWMDWDVVLPRIGEVLAPGGQLALLNRENALPWRDELMPVIARFSTNRDFQPFDLVAELERRGLFQVRSRFEAQPARSRQPIADYIESIHSMNGFSRDRLTTAAADAFDAAVRDIVAPFAGDGALVMETTATVVFGEPAGAGGMKRDIVAARRRRCAGRGPCLRRVRSPD